MDVSPQRHRFSLRTLLGAMTLVCVFLGAWTICQPWAMRDVRESAGGFWEPQPVAPYLLSVTASNNITVETKYFAWCFGAVVRLPYTARVSELNPVMFTVQPRIIFEFDEVQRLGVPAE